MNYSTYSAERQYTKSSDDAAKVSNILQATFGIALCIASVSTTSVVSASEIVIKPKRLSEVVILSEKDKKNGPDRNTVDIDVSVDEMANEIKNLLGLNTSDLAKILQVSRPTAYKYLEGEGPTDPALVSRMQQIYSLAAEWSNITNLPISKELKRIYPKSKSLLELMTQQEIDMKLLTLRVRELANIAEKRKNRKDISKNDKEFYQDNLERIASTVS